MNLKLKYILKNFSYAFISNLLTITISTLVVLVIPKFIDIEQYGYWQLYIFYSSYIGFLNIGWVEGIYLRYGGYKYDELDKFRISSQLKIFVIYNIIISCILFVYANLSNSTSNMNFILNMLSISIVIVLPRGFIYYLLQTTNRIIEYSKLVIIDRVIYCLLIIGILLAGITKYEILIAVDLLSKMITMIMSIYICRDLVFIKTEKLIDSIKEIKVNINVGFKLMLANISSILIIGVVRFFIEIQWDIDTFAKVSLTMSISNLIMTFVNAIGIIIYPLLRRISKDKLSEVYYVLRCGLSVFILFLLLFYFPIKNILGLWIPKYYESLRYMGLLFPICIYESKMAMIINTYLKALRKEDILLKINIITVCISLMTTIVSVFLIKNIELTIVSIVFFMIIRSTIAEMYIGKLLNIDVKKDIMLEIMMSATFIVSASYISEPFAIILYLISYIVYILIKKTDIYDSIKKFKNIIKT